MWEVVWVSSAVRVGSIGKIQLGYGRRCGRGEVTFFTDYNSYDRRQTAFRESAYIVCAAAMEIDQS